VCFRFFDTAGSKTPWHVGDSRFRQFGSSTGCACPRGCRRTELSLYVWQPREKVQVFRSYSFKLNSRVLDYMEKPGLNEGLPGPGPLAAVKLMLDHAKVTNAMLTALVGTSTQHATMPCPTSVRQLVGTHCRHCSEPKSHQNRDPTECTNTVTKPVPQDLLILVSMLSTSHYRALQPCRAFDCHRQHVHTSNAVKKGHELSTNNH
jgi:hypothetical protein